MRVKRAFLWCGLVSSVALCLFILVSGAYNILSESRVLAFGKLRPALNSLVENFAVTFFISVIFFILLLRERKALR